jgi:hypothetical protein
MTRVLQQILRFATLLIGMSVTSGAFAVATFDVTPTGPQANETTIKLFDSTDTEVKPILNSRRSFSVKRGTYSVEVYVGGAQIGPRRQTIELADGNYQLRVNSENGKVEPPVATPKSVEVIPGTQPPQLSMSVGRGFVMQDGFFYAVDPVTEKPIARASREMDGTAIDVMVRLGNGVEVNAGGLDGRNRSNGAQVPNGQQAAITFDNPQNGVTGFGSNGGADVMARTKFSNVHFNLALPAQASKHEDALLWEDELWEGFVRLGGGYTETKDRGTFNVIADPSIWSRTDMKVKGYDFHAGYELRGAHMFSNGLVGSVGVGADAIYYHAKYDGTQNFVCPICSAATQMFSVSTSDSKNRLTFGALGTVGLAYPVSEKMSLSFTIRYENEFGAPKLVNKNNPTDAATHIEKGNREMASAQLGVSVKF